MNKPKISIALADDHTMFRHGLIAILETYPDLSIMFDASNGLELLEQLKMSPVKPRICIVDVNMPVMHGYETVKNIRRLYPNMLILALSMYHDEINIIQMLRSGANGYVLKDSEPKVLVEAIRTVNEYGMYSSELITSDILQMVKYREPGHISFSARELDLIKLACTEMTYKEMAKHMELSERTIDGYRDRLFEKLGVKSRIGLVFYALRNGIVSLY